MTGKAKPARDRMRDRAPVSNAFTAEARGIGGRTGADIRLESFIGSVLAHPGTSAWIEHAPRGAMALSRT